MQKFQLYLFDFDGTLFNTIETSKYVFRKAYEFLGIPLNEDEVLQIEKYDAFMAQIEKYLNTTKESIDLTDIYDDTYDTIIDLRMDEADLGIVTSNNVPHVRDILRKFDMQKDFFTVLVGNREAPNPKPSPEPILKALEMINYKGDKKDVCYVGDSLNDCLAAVNAGVVPILLDRDDEYKDAPYTRIHSLSELL